MIAILTIAGVLITVACVIEEIWHPRIFNTLSGVYIIYGKNRIIKKLL